MDHISSEIQATLAPFHTHIGIFFQTLDSGQSCVAALYKVV